VRIVPPARDAAGWPQGSSAGTAKFAADRSLNWPPSVVMLVCLGNQLLAEMAARVPVLIRFVARDHLSRIKMTGTARFGRPK
jgi:hypothetical protein